MKDIYIYILFVFVGLVDTKIYRNWPGKPGKIYRGISKLVYMTPEDGAQSVIYCALSRDLEIETGKCISECRVNEPSIFSKLDSLFGEKVWEKAEATLKAKGFSLILKDDDDDE